MTPEQQALLERAVVALEQIASALHSTHGETVADVVGDVVSKLEDDNGYGVADRLTEILRSMP